MRLCTYRTDGGLSLGKVIGDEIVALDGDMGTLLAGGPAAMAAAERADGQRVPLAQVQLGPPVPKPPKFLAIAINYASHIKETGSKTPDFPVFFNKQTTCVIGHGEAIHRPLVSTMVDYEGELGMVIGRRCRHVPAERAHEVVAGYVAVNDVTVRDWQRKAFTFTIGKSFDTHGPIGPYLVTADEIPDPHTLGLRTFVNDELLQDGNTGDMVFDCWAQIATLSTAFTLEPGDIIATGTPGGVGVVREPPIFLKHGDTVRVEIDAIGTLENPVIDEPSDAPVIE